MVNHICSIKRGTHNKKGVCVLIGAGADISSGGILFRELKLRFLEENGCVVPVNINDKELDRKFEEQIDKMSQNGRCETLESIMQRHKSPSEGYLLLVMFAELGYIDAVITTNFDYLLEETQDLLNIKPFTIYTPGRAIPEDYYLKRNKIAPIYLKMHGDLYDRLVTHLTEYELKNKYYGDKFIKMFTHIIQTNSIIIIGYGGYDNLITDIFKQEINNIDEVYWCNINEPTEDSELATTLEQHKKLCFINTSFDKFFQDLAKKLLKDIKLKNINPIFLPTVVQSQIENQRILFKEKLKCSNKLINRIEFQEKLESFLETFDNKCLAVTGEYKYGKSCFIYKAMLSFQDITFFPIMFDNNHNILKSIVQALGYDTDTPFPILYNFLKWWNEKNKHLVFVIDNFFNQNIFKEISYNDIIEFFNLLYIIHEFKCIQFIVCFQTSVYEKVNKNNSFEAFKNIFTKEIEIGKFSEKEVLNLLTKNGIVNNELSFEKQELLYIPYIWSIISIKEISLANNVDIVEQYIDTIFNFATTKYNFTKHAFNSLLRKLAFNQLFERNEQVNLESQEYIFLKEEGILDTSNKIVYLELAKYFCKQFFLNYSTWEDVITEKIIPDIQKNIKLKNIQIDIYVSIWAKAENIDSFNFILKSLENIIQGDNTSIYLSKIVIKVLQSCFKHNTDLFEDYLTNIDINTYSYYLQRYLFKVCFESNSHLISIWNKCNLKNELSYTAFILENDSLFYEFKNLSEEGMLSTDFLEKFKYINGLTRLFHLMTYWGWDNVRKEKYVKLKEITINDLLPILLVNNKSIKFCKNNLIGYAYNIFFNAGEDFEEQFIRCRNITSIDKLAKKLLNKIPITKDDYSILLKLNTDINNSWIFILSNIIVIQTMNICPAYTYDMLYHFWDDNPIDVQVQHLDFFLSSAFWSLYINEPNDREKFVELFEMIVEKYERILFMFPKKQRLSSLYKFSEEFERTFEDGFNPMAFYFYTAPYKSLTIPAYKWDNGKKDLKIYWDLVQCMSDLGKFDDTLRIIHALGQMISIYPEEGYSALENIIGFDQPIIKRGLVRIFKENYLRYSKLTKKELKKANYYFDVDDVEDIKYNPEFLLENRTLEQLHWGRLFYNLQQIMDINVSEVFLSNMLKSHSCSEFLCKTIKCILNYDIE